MKEYGSNIQKLVDYLVTIDDREKRTRQAFVMVELMRQLHPQMKEGQDYTVKLWDDLYIMSKFKLDVDSPFPPPSPESIGKKPLRVPYGVHNLRFRHYGHNLEVMIAKAVALDDLEERWAFTSYIAKMMKNFYTTWNRSDGADDKSVMEHLMILSSGQLRVEIEKIRTDGYLDVAPRDRYSSGSQALGMGYNSTQPTHVPQQFGQRNQGQGGKKYFNKNKNGKGHFFKKKKNKP